MRECFWYFLPISVILFYYVLRYGYYLVGHPTRTILLEFLGLALLLIFLVLTYFDLLNLSIVSAVFILVILLCLIQYRDIQRFINRRRMKDKARALDNIENSLLFYCLAKHKPQKINYYYQLGQEPLDNDSIKEIISSIKIELAKNGTGPDNDPNEHGLQLKYLADEITETYLSPES